MQAPSYLRCHRHGQVHHSLCKQSMITKKRPAIENATLWNSDDLCATSACACHLITGNRVARIDQWPQFQH